MEKHTEHATKVSKHYKPLTMMPCGCCEHFCLRSISNTSNPSVSESKD